MHIPETVKTYGLILVIIIASFWLASRFIEPTPPNTLTIAAGAPNGQYYAFAQRYKEILATNNIKVNVLTTAGSQENAALIVAGKADIGFIQSGLATDANKDAIESLGSLYYEPLWVFTNATTINTAQRDIQQLVGKTIAIGTEGSGTKVIALKLLELNNMVSTTTPVLKSGDDAVLALKNREIDAAFFVGRPDSANINTLLRDPDLSLLSFDRAAGYTRLLPYLSAVTLNQGVIDMALNMPQKDHRVLSPVAQLATRADFNGALKTLLVQTAFKIHGDADLFAAKGRFPTVDYADFPIAEEAARYFKYGPNLLQRFLPFWLADMISRMVVMLIPLIGIMLPLMKLASPTYKWRTRSKIYKWYKHLKKMEDAAQQSDTELKTTLAALEKIDRDVKKTQVPLSYADELYTLRMHIKMIRERLDGAA